MVLLHRKIAGQIDRRSCTLPCTENGLQWQKYSSLWRNPRSCHLRVWSWYSVNIHRRSLPHMAIHRSGLKCISWMIGSHAGRRFYPVDLLLGVLELRFEGQTTWSLFQFHWGRELDTIPDIRTQSCHLARDERLLGPLQHCWMEAA